ncbi:phage portal protein family protein [Dactylosporangium sp. CA-139066]|uniref:phage portal protein family protein n=1 Tax=Dactylosporangium sp. CA-139066 TaxID=3239930 RepID=UPI003D8D23B5
MATAPTTLRGYLDDQLTYAYNAAYGSILTDLADHVPDCLWPSSNETYRQMRKHHQLAAVLGAYSLPIRRAQSAVNPAGCRDEVVKLVADDLGLPVFGHDEPGAARVRGVSWAEHLRLALLNLSYGHSGFEMLAEIRDGLARLVELSERLPATISEIHVDKVGRFAGVTQHMYTGKRVPQIRADQMVWYAREREGAAWWGQSLLRPAYPAWLLSREMLRVMATGHRRFSVGVPTGEWDAGVMPSPEQHAELQRAMTSARVGETGGMALPPGAHMKLVGLTGSVPDTLAFVRYLDQAMSRMALAGFLDLGTSESGSRALAGEFIDLFLLATQAEADAVADTITRQAAARLVEWNWGADEPVPAVQIGDVGARHEVTAEALNLLLGSGALSADPALEAHIRRQYKLPEREGMAKPAPSVAGDTIAAANRPARARSSRRKEPAPGQLELPVASAAEEPAADLAQLQADWETARGEVLDRWPDTAADLAAGLAAAAAALVAAGALAGLGSLAADAAAATTLAGALSAAMAPLAAAAAVGAAAEASAVLGRTVSAPAEVGGQLDELASVFAGQVTASYAQAASRRAVLFAPGTAEAEVTAELRAYLDDISTSRTGLVADIVGGALTSAQNAGRSAVFAELANVVFVSDETLDRNTCVVCADANGTEYPDWADARAVYPVAGHHGCLGGLRCRGALRIKLAN